MAFEKQGLINSIQGKLDNLSEGDRVVSLSVHTAWADGISEYIKDNLTVSGFYTGLTNTVPSIPDPATGIYDWDVSTLVLTGSMLLAAVTGQTVPAIAFTLWVGVIDVALKTMVFTGFDSGVTPVVTASPGLVFTPFAFSITQNDIKNESNNLGIVTIVGGKLYDSIMATAITGLTTAATSVTPGSGTVTYASVG